MTDKKETKKTYLQRLRDGYFFGLICRGIQTYRAASPDVRKKFDNAVLADCNARRPTVAVIPVQQQRR